KCTVRKEPKGVVLIIGAWNYPLHLLILPMVGAIAAGNCVVLKPSEVATHSSEFIAKVIPQYLDKRAYSVVQGGVEETTALLNEQFDHIFYTGNGHVGRIIMAAAAKHLTSVTLELGGKSPVVVAPDANLKVAASRIVWAKYFNAGQVCVAPDYVLIAKTHVEEFIDHCRNVIKERFGNNPQLSDSYGRLINERRFNAIQNLLTETDPMKILVGGQTDKEDLYVAPTIVSPVEPSNSTLMNEEIFGPILPIVPVDDVDEAINIINSKIRQLSSRNTQSGGVVVNDLLMHILELSMPFGGAGASGMGSYHGSKSFDTFTHERATMMAPTGLESALIARYPPYTDSKNALFSLLTLGLPKGFMRKVKSMFAAIQAARNIYWSENTNDIDDKKNKL
ncbi:Aldehyde/histidinol dehydrogenase, partial [Mycotypha africana]|uniref:Aldehyde/histidinol dehydrogenase n=1 Tax=Mycotypha africana TaxID=64632 RepID=UPI002301BAF4